MDQKNGLAFTRRFVIEFDVVDLDRRHKNRLFHHESASRKHPGISLPRPANADPVDDRCNASDQTKRYKTCHNPHKFGRVRDLQYPASEIDGGPANQRVPNRAGNENQNQQARSRILKCARSRDGCAKRKGGRCQAGDDQHYRGVPLHLPLQVAEEPWFHQPLQAFLATFPANQVQQENADSGSGGSRQHAERELAGMPRNQKHCKQIAADRKKEKGIVRNGKEEESEDTILKEKVQKMADRKVHT